MLQHLYMRFVKNDMNMKYTNTKYYTLNIIQFYSGIACGRGFHGELYTTITEVTLYIFVLAVCGVFTSLLESQQS